MSQCVMHYVLLVLYSNDGSVTSVLGHLATACNVLMSS